ncbi:hypothetical protein C8F04DRAFT_1196078 [Mycena alexandri]|uniref:CxC5 like cysteine cluster associated with KDZ domain-containing protein n=1 Tax=Mycena alexandri TaxID=1745969 RepID=A0AAD6S652_9AGAR|nr:hypothetical protein C8F04DRAFT_1196078 [Mycena alexandri]
MVMYPPSDFCTNPKCGRCKRLKKAHPVQIVVYTLASGVVPAWEVQLYCPDCNTTYYPNYSAQHGTRTYHDGDIPQYISIGAHHVSATNCSRAYNMALSSQEERDFAAGGWQFGCKLTTDHVWDSFILLTLLDYHQRRKTRLQVPHTVWFRIFSLTEFSPTAITSASNDELLLKPPPPSPGSLNQNNVNQGHRIDFLKQEDLTAAFCNGKSA